MAPFLPPEIAAAALTEAPEKTGSPSSETKLAQPQNIMQPEEQSPPPSLVTLDLGHGVSQDMEIIQWPGGGFLLPVKAFAALFGLTAQQPVNDTRILFADPVTGKHVELNWKTGTLTVNGQNMPSGKLPVVYSEKGLVVGSDVYLDQAVLGSLLQADFKFDEYATTLSLSTPRKLNVPDNQDVGGSQPLSSGVKVVGQPKVYRAILEKVYVRNTSNYVQQIPRTMGAGPFRNNALNSMMDSATIGASGSLWGQDYYFKPTLTHFNGKVNFQSIDWSVQHAFQNSVLSLGSSDSGLSALSSPNLNVWGLKLASRNAVGPALQSKNAYDFSGQAASGHEIQARINGRTVQSAVAQEDGYALESVYLQPQAINHLQLVEVDDQHHEKVLVDKKIANYANLLTKGEVGYSAFAGRAPLLFFPPLPDRKTPFLMPQSEKWLAGGRVFYGLSDRVTVGLSAVADHVFGQPRSYYTSLDPFSIDLTGINSYLRDSNYFQGQNLSASLRYQMTDHWLLSADTGISRFDLLPGSRLPIGSSNFDSANQIHLERQGARMTWFMDAFRYGSNYYTPSVMLYGNNLYDKRGLSTGVNGVLSSVWRTNYSVKWNRYQTNFQGLIPGGVIDANQWNGSLTSHINDRNDLVLGLNWTHGSNRIRDFAQHSLDLTWRTQSLPWRLTGEVRASRYFTNTIFFPSATSGLSLSQSDYTNNSLDLSLNIPLNQTRSSYLRVGNRISTFVNYASVQAFFRYRQFSFEPLVQVSYGDRPQIQNRFGLKVGYRFKSGASFSVGYYKNFSTFSAANTLGGSYHSQVDTNQFYLDFSDIFSLFGNTVRSLGPNSDSTGMVVGKIFADYQANGKPDSAEPGVRGVQVLIDNQVATQTVQTDAKGHYAIAGLSAGYHTIEVVPQSLPLTLGSDNPTFKIKVATGKTQRLDIPLSPEGGKLSGHIRLENIKGEALPVESMVLVLNGANGHVLNYTTPDASGFYQFANIPAGRYQVDLEPRLKSSGRFRVEQAPPMAAITIPKSYEESVEVEHHNLKLLAL